MNAVLLALGSFLAYFIMYKIYHRYIAVKIFGIQESEITPAHTHCDGVDYVPTQKYVLWGHHFSSIAGAAPIVGPAIAVIWGWLPAMLWVVLGSIFIGAVHDGGTLILSAKRQGKTIADISGNLISPRSKVLFLTVIFFLIWTVIAVFALIIAVLFDQYPQTVIPINAQIILALAMGWWAYKRKGSLLIPSLISLAIMYALIPVGIAYPISLQAWLGLESLQNFFIWMGAPNWLGSPVMLWILFLCTYSFIASILPVWTLLQPRDFINSHQLSLGLICMYLGFFVTMPKIVAPAIQLHPNGAPSIFPFLFITIACGAISGFHGLVSSGTTSKQLDKMTDAPVIGCGSMLGEGTLALMAVLACTAGFMSSESWFHHYSSWDAASGLSQKLGAFIEGTSHFLSGIKIPAEIAKSTVVVLIIAFAATSLDTATRIQRFIIAEIGSCFSRESIRKPLENRYFGSFMAVFSAFLLIMSGDGGKGGMVLWPLFGASNQLIAAFSLAVISYWLIKMRKNSLYTSLPLVFVLVMVLWAMGSNMKTYWLQGNRFLFASQLLILLCVFFFAFEVLRALFQLNPKKK